MGALEHDLLRLGVVLPAAARLEVHRAQFPLLERVVDAAQEARVLLFVGDREPVLDELDARADQHLLELGHRTEELLVLLVGAEPHHPLHAGAVVPAAVEQHHLARSGQVRGIALEVPLGAFAVVGRGQCGHPAHPRVEPLGDPLDDAALAGSIAALEQDHHLVARGDHPVLQLDQFTLQPEQLLEVEAPTRLLFVRAL